MGKFLCRWVGESALRCLIVLGYGYLWVWKFFDKLRVTGYELRESDKLQVTSYEGLCGVLALAEAPKASM